jgi:hypothetical protein
MCNVFSGLVVTKKGKNWGKVLFDSGVHHEKDRKKFRKKYGDNVLAWESNVEYSLKDGFKFTHTLNVDEKQRKELMKLVQAWAKKQKKEKLLRQMVTVVKDNRPTDEYEIVDNMIKTGDKTTISADFKTHIIQGDKSTATQGDESAATQGDWSTAIYGDGSIITQ